MISNSRAVRTVPIDDLKSYPNNPIIFPRKMLRKIEAIVRRHDQIPTILVSSDMTIVSGEEWWRALKAAGKTHAKVEVLADLSPAEINTVRLALGRLPFDARIDSARLRAELTALLAQGVDLEHTAYDQPEIDFALELDMPRAHVVENVDAVPAFQARAISTRGDIFQLAEHRVGCGDLRDQAFMDRLREGRLADACITDPPFNSPNSGFGNERSRPGKFLEAPGEMSGLDYFTFLERCLTVLRTASNPSALIFLFIDRRHVLELTAAGKRLEMPLLDIAVWVKPNGELGGLYRSAHELCAIFKAGAEPHRNNLALGKFGRNRTNVWSYAPLAAGDLSLGPHPTAKPVAMLADVMRDCTKRGDLIVDGFLGSGSALIAAHETGRTCFGIELDPHHLDVSIRRWQALTGLDAVHTKTGQRFDDITRRLLKGRTLNGE